jgi:hypothetical protein
VKAAWQVEQLINNGSGIPDFLTDAVAVALNEAAGIKGVTIWKEAENGDGEDYDVEALADLFTVSQLLDIEPDGNQKVLRAVHELLNNPRTPTALYEAIAEFICSQSQKLERHSTLMLDQVLKSVQPEEWIGPIM